MNGVMKWCTTLDACKMSFFFTDGKPWKMARPGWGDAADALVRAAGGDDVNLVQQAYYNGHYGFAGGKVQHVLLFYMTIASSRCNGATRVINANHAVCFYVNNNPLQLVKCITDKAYG